MFSQSKICVLPLLLLLVAPCSSTTIVLILTPRFIVAGADRRTNDIDSIGKFANQGTTTKVILLGGRQIIACIGMNKWTPQDRSATYDFQVWIKQVSAKIAPNTPISVLADIVEREATRTFTKTVPIERMMRDGTLPHAKAIDKFLTQFIVAGFENGSPVLVEINFPLDWKNNLLLPAVRGTGISPNSGSYDFLYVDGQTDEIGPIQLHNTNSYCYKRMKVLAPGSLEKIHANKMTDRTEAVRTVRALITVEAEKAPQVVGSGSTIVVLPTRGVGDETNYDVPLTVRSQQERKQEKKLKK